MQARAVARILFQPRQRSSVCARLLLVGGLVGMGHMTSL